MIMSGESDTTAGRVLRGLFIGEDSLGHRTVYENIKAASEGTSLHAHLVNLAPHPRMERLPIPRSVASSLTMRSEVLRMVARIRPQYLITNTHKPVVFCHDLVSKLPTAMSMDATPLQFDRLGYFVDSTDRVRSARRAKYLLIRSLFQRAAALLPWSTWVAQSLVSEYGVERDRVFVVPPGIDTNFWAPVSKPDRVKAEIVFVGGDFERKGGNDLLAWHRRSGRGRARLTVVTRSDLDDEPDLRVVRAANNSPELRELVRTADMFVLPTRADCFSIAGQEAMASGVPVVLGDVGGISDLVEPGVTGFLVPPGDAASLETAMDALLSSGAVRRDMGYAARDRAVALFDQQHIFRRLLEIGEGMVDQKQAISPERNKPLPA